MKGIDFYFRILDMDRESRDSRKKGKKSKVGVVNDSFELASNSVRNKVRSVVHRAVLYVKSYNLKKAKI